MVENRVSAKVLLDNKTRALYTSMGLKDISLSYDVFESGMVGYYHLLNAGDLGNRDIFTIIDFSKASTEKRLYVIDLVNNKVLFHTYVAHGRNTGENLAKSFSNRPHSNQSSLGFYVTGETYVGSKGYSLRLDGQEKDYNSNIRSRAVVVHAADYVSEYWIEKYGRLGRSQGCPALPKALSKKIIDTIKGKSAMFAYYPDKSYEHASALLDIESLLQKIEKNSEILDVDRAVAAD